MGWGGDVNVHVHVPLMMCYVGDVQGWVGVGTVVNVHVHVLLMMLR